MVRKITLRREELRLVEDRRECPGVAGPSQRDDEPVQARERRAELAHAAEVPAFVPVVATLHFGHQCLQAGCVAQYCQDVGVDQLVLLFLGRGVSLTQKR